MAAGLVSGRRAASALAALFLSLGSLGCDSPAAQAVSANPAALGASAAPRARPTYDDGMPVAASGPKPAGLLKGQLHMHSGRSADSRTPPDVAARWYERHGFDFIVFTDHNVVTDTDDSDALLTIPGMELTQNLPTCSPPSARGRPCLIHVTGLFLDPSIGTFAFPPAVDPSRTELYGRAAARGQAWGGLVMLNHPNYADAADLGVVMDLAARGVFLMEVENRAIDSANEGDLGRPSTEELWDEALGRGARMFATATDDAHHYEDADAVARSGELAYRGDRGWVMVRATRDAASIRAALERGDFYASTGLVADTFELTKQRLRVHVESEGVELEVVGPGGRVLAEARGPTLDYAVPEGTRGYLRVRATDARGRRALFQPVFFDGR
jgi:hypothetical protein